MKYRKHIIMIMLLIISSLFCSCADDSGENESVNVNKNVNDMKNSLQKETESIQKTDEPEVLKVKNVVGKVSDNAKWVLESQGFSVQVSEEYSDDVEEGYVISQTPTADNDLSLSKGDVIKIVVSKGKEQKVINYLDTKVYAGYESPCSYNTMSAYSGKDLYDNDCTRAIKFECDASCRRYDENAETEQTMKVTYLVEEGIKSFSATLSPVRFRCDLKKIHVNLYKDDELIYSMDISEDTAPLELLYDIEGADTFTIELKYLLSSCTLFDNTGSIVFSEAKFE